VTVYTSDELIRLIEAAGESANIDAKAAMAWDGAETSASLTKDIISFANSRDGGVIVLGKDEVAAGKFSLSGLTPAQADSFETTRVASWVNAHCDPPVTLVCYRVQHNTKEFIVLAVAEFDDVPVICSKQFELQGKPQRVLLRKGTLYVRTVNAESAPLSTIEELRTLIGLATTKRADQLLSMFQAMMKGRPLLADKSEDEHWVEQADVIRSILNTQPAETVQLGRWSFCFHPTVFQEERWESAGDMRRLIEKHAVRLLDEFPSVRYDFHVQEWGISSNEFEDQFGLARSGLFFAERIFREDKQAFKNPWQPNPDIPAGQWMEFQWNMAHVIEFFMFMSRFCHEFDPEEEVVYEVSASPLSNRSLVSLNPRVRLFRVEPPCRAVCFRRVQTIAVGTLRSAWEDECVRTLQRFFEFFGSERTSVESLQKWVEQFKSRTYWQ